MEINDAARNARKLLMDGKAKHVAVLMLLYHVGTVSMNDLRYALAPRPGARAGFKEVYAIVRELVEMGLVEERVIGVLGKRKARIYNLTDLGVRVAGVLAQILQT